MKFGLIDRIIELTRGERIVAVKAVTLAEEYLADHFPTFPVLPGVFVLEALAEAGAWRYSFIYDLVHHYYPDLPEKARPIKRSEAQQKLLDLAFISLGAATAGEVRKLFQWPRPDMDRALVRLEESGRVTTGYEVEGKELEHMVSVDFLQAV